MVLHTNLPEQFLQHPVVSSLVFGGAAVAIGAGGVAVARTVRARRKASRPKAKKKTTRRTVKRKKARAKPKRKRTYKYARTAGKGKDTSTRRIRQTKNGQPYVILANGRARFISKKSAAASRKRKGGRY